MEGKGIEEVKEYRYLGCIFQRNRGKEAQVKDRVKRSAVIMGQVWGIRKRKFRGDWRRRLWLFNRSIWTVMGYEIEVWNWEERESAERVEE